MAQYKTGLATFTNGSSTVTGTGTAWASNLSAGDYIVRRGDALNTYQAYQIGGINSNTSLSLTAPYGGSTASNVAYVAHVDFIDNDRPELSNGDIETAAIMNRWIASIAQLAQLGTAANLDAQTSPTDATVNRVMKVGAFGLGASPGKPRYVGDLNAILTTGFDNIGVAGCTNFPLGAGDGNLITQMWDSAVAGTQLYFELNAGKVYFRRRLAGVWLGWSDIYSQASIIGLVSQSGGVPTGAIIQYIPNTGLGSAVLFADGTVLAMHRDSTTYTTSTSFPPLYRAPTLPKFTFPVAFVAAPEVSIHIEGLNGKGLWAGTTTAPSATSTGDLLMIGVDNSGQGRFTYFASGRWYL